MNKYQPNTENALQKSPLGRQTRGFLLGLGLCLLSELIVIYPFACYLASDVRAHIPVPGTLRGLSPLYTFLGFFTTLPELPVYISWPTPAVLGYVGPTMLIVSPATVLLGLLVLLSSRRHGYYYGVEHGSARWAASKDREPFADCPGAIPLQHGLYVKPGRDNGRLNNYHKITFGSTGSGKTFRDLIPELLAHTGCYVVADVKGVLYMQTANHMRNAGYCINVLNLKDMRYSHGFNPLAYVREDNEITSLIATFIQNSRKDGANAGDQFWEDSMELVLGSMTRYLLDTPGEDKTFTRIVRLIGGLELVQGRVADYCEYEQKMQQRARRNTADTAVELWRLFKQAPAETLQSVLISLSSRLKLWTTDGVRMLTAKDEFNLRELAVSRDKKTLIYVILPPKDVAFKPISAMFFQTLFNVLEDAAVNGCEGKLPQLWSILMDECANLGKIPDFSAVLTLMRAYGVRICPYFQSKGQVQNLYDKEADTIISSCAVYNYLGVSDPDTYEDISKRLGDTTIEEETPAGRAGERETARPIGRRLLAVDEVPRLDKDDSIVFIPGLPAFRGRKNRTENMPGAQELGIDDDKHPHWKNNRFVEADLAELYAAHRDAYRAAMEAVQLTHKPLNLLDLPETGDEETGGKRQPTRSAADFEMEVGFDGGWGSEPPEDAPETAAGRDPETVLEADFERGFIEAMKSKNR